MRVAIILLVLVLLATVAFPVKSLSKKTLKIRGGAFESATAASNDATPEAFAVSPPRLSLFQNVISLFTSTEAFFSRFIAPLASDPDITAAIAKFFSYAFWLYLTMCILGTIGIDTKPFLTSLNVALITLGFAAKDIITNSFAGIYILFTRPFSRGNIVRIAGYRGKVVSIDIRFVKLEDMKDRSQILIPLSMVYGSAVVVERNDVDGSTEI